MDWNDVKIFLALVRAGSVRAAATKLGISHSTVARRVDAFETRMGVKLLDRLASGYALTSAGEDVLGVAENVESEFDGMQRRLAGRDRQLAGTIRVTLIDVIATHLLMPDLAEFNELHPDIDLEVVMSYEPLDLARREADIAIRFVKNPPGNFIGHRLASVAKSAYATQDYLDHHDLADPTSASWIGFGSPSPHPKWVKRSHYPHLPAKGIYYSMQLQLEAARCGIGIASLPCFLGDSDPDLVRLPPGTSVPLYDLWILRHSDTRSTARLRAFSEFISSAIVKYRPLLEGLEP